MPTPSHGRTILQPARWCLAIGQQCAWPLLLLVDRLSVTSSLGLSYSPNYSTCGNSTALGLRKYSTATMDDNRNTKVNNSHMKNNKCGTDGLGQIRLAVSLMLLLITRVVSYRFRCPSAYMKTFKEYARAQPQRDKMVLNIMAVPLPPGGPKHHARQASTVPRGQRTKQCLNPGGMQYVLAVIVGFRLSSFGTLK